ncbi:MAG: transcription initiation factor IIB [Promethearchaeota archaeon]
MKLGPKKLESASATDWSECPECGGNIVETTGHRACSSCGLVTGRVFAPGIFSLRETAESGRSHGRRYVEVGKRVDAVGTLGSFIGHRHERYLRDCNRRPVSSTNQQLFNRLKRTYDLKARIRFQETTYRIMNVLASVVSALELSRQTQEFAAYLFKKIKRAASDQIRNHVALLAFCLLAAVRRDVRKAPVSIKEIALTFQDLGHRVTPRLILRQGLVFKRHVTTELVPKQPGHYLPRLLDGVPKLERLAQRLKSKEYEFTPEEYKLALSRVATDLAKEFEERCRGGRNPFILAGAIIYAANRALASQMRKKPVLTQGLVARATGIAEYSIRDHYVGVVKPFMEWWSRRGRDARENGNLEAAGP